jgi:hypothetical protein
VRNKEKKETDFLITDRNRPHALVETELTETDPDPSLVDFPSGPQFSTLPGLIDSGRRRGKKSG